METTKLSTKGQVVLPKAVRIARGWRPGMKFSIVETSEGVLLRPMKPFPPTRVEDVIGCIPYNGPPKSIRQMDEGVLLEAKRRHARGRY